MARVAYLAKVPRWYCNECKKQFSTKVGTVFEDFPIGLGKSLPAMSCRAPVRNLALRARSRLGRDAEHGLVYPAPQGEAVQSTFDMFSGTVEVDEASICGKHKNKSLKERVSYATVGMRAESRTIGATNRGPRNGRTRRPRLDAPGDPSHA